MTSLQLFNYGTHEVRTILIDGEPWFVLNDLCEVLQISNPYNVVDRLDREYLRKTEVLDGRGLSRETNVVNESGMYEVVIRSNAPAAAAFRKWLVNDVLPTIRKTGSYSAPKSLEEQTLEVMGALRSRVQEQAEELEAARPKVAQADLSRDADGHETIGDLANRIQLWAASNHPSYKVLHKEVFDLAGELGIVIRGNTKRNNQPTSQAIKANWVRIKETVVETNNHGNILKISTRLTPRGTARVWDAAITRITNSQPLVTRTESVAA